VADRPLNATAASLLGFLEDGPLSGYELAATAERTIGDFWSLTQSQVYRELAWMTDAAFVEPGESGARDRRAHADQRRAGVRGPAAASLRRPATCCCSPSGSAATRRLSARDAPAPHHDEERLRPARTRRRR
jgi:hypothetical protein